MKDVLLLHGGVGSDSSIDPILNGFAKRSFLKDPLDSVVRAVVFMEDEETFNAGTGSVMRLDGTIQMDACVMTPGHVGSVMGIERVKNPVLVARDVMEKSPHVIFAGDGATAFARIMGHEDYDPSTEKSRKRLEKVKLDLESSQKPGARERMFLLSMEKTGHDTVGAVARIGGRFAAAVSTGGASPMMRGRVGDSPVPGSGIFAGENGSVVATGIGEDIIRRSFCFRIYSRIGEKPLKQILDEEVAYFGDVAVGVIAVSRDEVAYSANKDMATGYIES